eukprot:TRINITY_DN876_c0_g1_i1.p1 TRINITY_DN876_c0_g1~~TRINITY_DN876_c0_g1_i1.p1  ORF type:complete len:1335 (-),score=198.02 TRINITY_DN876_c0_g1_i1:3763-7671(-)
MGDCLRMQVQCGYNKLKCIPHTLLNHLKLDRLSYMPNPLTDMPTFANTFELAAYLHAEGMKKTVRWNRIKLAFVGPENVGKTTLMNRFRNLPHDGISTDGIQVKELQIQELTFSAWDFGGQAVFLPTHQFFLTGRALYLVLFNLMDPDLHRIEYWLRQITKSVKSPPAPPVILVGTRADKCDSAHARQVCNTILHQFKCLGQTLACVPISTTSKDGNISELEDWIVRVAVTKYMILRDKIPGTWLLLDTTLNREKARKQVVRWEQFVTWGRECGIRDDDELKRAAGFLHSVGTILYFDGKFSKLGQLIVLDPQYLANLLCTIVTFKPSFVRNGFLPRVCIPQIWRSYDEKDHPLLIDLLCTFLIMHPLTLEDGTDGFIVPCILPPKDDVTLCSLWAPTPPNGVVQHERWYSFTCLPIGLFGRLLVRILHLDRLVKKHFFTDNLVVEQMPKDQDPRPHVAFVNFTAVSGNNPSLIVRVRSPVGVEPSLLLQLVDCVETTLRCFYASYMTDMQQRIACNSCPTSASCDNPQPHLFTLEEVVTAITQGSPSIFCPIQHIHVRLDFLCPFMFTPSVAQISEADLTGKTEIAQGGFGKVYRAKWQGEDVAVKELIFKDSSESLSQFLEFKQEVSIMSLLDSPFVVKLFAMCVHPLCMVMELVPHGDLYKLLHEDYTIERKTTKFPVGTSLESFSPGEDRYQLPLSWKLRAKIALDIAKGIQYMHTFSPPIVHRDLRSPNIFIQTLDDDAPVRAKVADFGLSVRAAQMSGTLITWPWLAPEVIDAQNDEYNEQSDIFSLGIVMLELTTRHIPYDEYATNPKYCTNFGDRWEWRPQNIKAAITKENLRPSIPDYVPEYFRSLILSCWAAVPKERPTAVAVVKRLEDILGIVHPPPVIEYDTPEPPQLDEPVLSWNVPQETKVWSFGVGKHHNSVVAGCGNGSLRKFDSSGHFELQQQIQLSTRCFCLLTVGDHIWASSDIGQIYVIDPENMKVVKTIQAHGSKEVVKLLLLVERPEPRKGGNSGGSASRKVVWSASSTESSIVVIDPETYEIVDRISLEPSCGLGSLVQCGPFVWVGCYAQILVFHCRGTLQRALPSRKVSSAVRLHDRVWVATDIISVYDAATMKRVAAIHEAKCAISQLFVLEEYVWSATSAGMLHAWHPRTMESVRRLEIPNLLALLVVGSAIWFSTSASSKAGVGCYALRKPDRKPSPSPPSSPPPTRAFFTRNLTKEQAPRSAIKLGSGRERAQQHTFRPTTFSRYTYCAVCGDYLWDGHGHVCPACHLQCHAGCTSRAGECHVHCTTVTTYAL